jgi:hypothetical protein
MIGGGTYVDGSASWAYSRRSTRPGGRRVASLLIVVSAILTFAVQATVAGLDLKVVGWILMLAAWRG